MKHPPGPWEIDRFPGNSPYLIANNLDVVCLFNHHARIKNDVREGNAHLIAAAPDLLGACKLVMDYFKYGGHLPSIILRAAIEKAEGGTP